jgi:surface antigen
VSDEPTPNPLGDLLDTRDASPENVVPLVPQAPQFSSRRELREATQHRGRRAPAAPEAAKARPEANAASVAKAPRLAKESRKERAIARRLAVQSAPASPATPAKKKQQNPALAMFVLLVVSGFIGGVALPAYAFTPVAPGGVRPSVAKTSPQDLQELKVADTAAGSLVKRDVITATSEAEYKAQQINAAAFAAYNVGPRAAGDDYPWPHAGNTLSPLNYFYRQCVDFVAWRLNRDAGVTSAPWKWTWTNLTPNGGNASQWKSAWEAHGWKTSAKPVNGSVAWFVGNHVAYVKSIQGKNVVIEEYNGISSLAYNIRTIPIDTVGRFLYPPP